MSLSQLISMGKSPIDSHFKRALKPLRINSVRIFVLKCAATSILSKEEYKSKVSVELFVVVVDKQERDRKFRFLELTVNR